MVYNKITENIIGATIEINKELDPRLLESAYQECLLYKLKDMGYAVKKEVIQPIAYKEITLTHGYQIDLLVENKIVIELKQLKNLLMFILHKF